MNQTIGGKYYSTETAILVCECSSPCDKTSFGFWEAGLYVTPRGAFFLSGAGGPSSMFAKVRDTTWRATGCGIVPVTKSEALTFCEAERCDVSTLRLYFDIEDA